MFPEIAFNSPTLAKVLLAKFKAPVKVPPESGR
jgi:hypothetical protein